MSTRSADAGVDVTVAQAAKLVDGAREVLLLGHLSPDADALGSAVALGLALRRRGARVTVSFGAPAEVPESLRHLDSERLFVPAGQLRDAARSVPELIVALDCSSIDRLGVLADLMPVTVAAGGALLVVDHHLSNTGFGTHNLVDTDAEATATMVARLLDELGAPIDEPIARCLYAGLATDTGHFHRATGDTHRLAARLLDAGVDPRSVLAPLDARPFGWLSMLAGVFGRARLEPDAAGGHGLVHSAVLLTDLAGPLAGAGASDPGRLRAEDPDSVVDLLRSVHDAEVAAVFKQVAANRWTVSLRAHALVDVRAAALHFGGGGHRLAAGFTTDGELADVLAELRAALDDAAGQN